MKYTLPKDHLSASSIGTLLNCPKQYEFRYINGIINPPNAALAIGSVTHKTLQTYYNDAINSTQRLTSAQAAELGGDTFSEWVHDNENTMSDTERNEASNTVVNIVFNYVDKVGKHINPKGTEVEFKTNVGDVPMLGYIDLLYKLNESTAIADYKITSKKLSLSDLVNSLQFNLYAICTGIGDIEIHNMVKTESKRQVKPSTTPGVIDYHSGLRTIHHVFDGSQADHFINLVQSAAKLITSGIFMPCAPTSWCCTPDWCGYWKMCRGKRS